MVIYDKNQFTFNLIFILILIASIMINVIYAQNFTRLNSKYIEINQKLAEIEDNQRFNFIQGVHNDIDYQLLSTGFHVISADDYGKFDGQSMQPTIFDDNVVIERKYNGEELDEGQIVRFIRDDGTPVIHRIRADYGDTILVQGDSLKESEIIDKEDITHIIVGVLYT